MSHRIYKLQKLITARQRELLRAHWHALHLFCGVAIHNPRVFRHLKHMPQSRKRVVVAV